MTAEIGRRFQLRDHHGYDPTITTDDPRHPDNADMPTRAPDGTWTVGMHVGMHPLYADQVGTVVGHIAAGVMHDGLPRTVLEFSHHHFIGHGADPSSPAHEPSGTKRHCSFTDAELAEMFTEATD